MAEVKTVLTGASVAAYLDAIADDERRRDCKTLVKLMRKATGHAPRMWGTSIVGFGAYHYRYTSGREGDCCPVGFAPRKGDISIYLMPGLDIHQGRLTRLGKHRAGKACLNVKRLADIDVSVLEEMVTASVEHVKRTHP